MIKLLDCTLRDGGYVNKWNFGKNVIDDIMSKMFKTNVDIIEAGFIRDVEYDCAKAVFCDLSQLDTIIEYNGIDKEGYELASMAEIAHPIPLSYITEAANTTCDIIRVIVWKSKHTENGEEVDALQESFEYCKGIIEKGYKLCVQPNRTDQYSDEEFVNMLKMFASLNPYAIYVVDSWGTMYSNKVLHYMEIADRILPKEIAIGFHGHNNMMQAFSTAEKIIERDFDRLIILDASVDGIGRGAGNLNLELIAKYLNQEKKANYILTPIYEIYDEYIKPLKNRYTWGSSLPFMISADNNANPNYATDFDNEHLRLTQMSDLYQKMSTNDRILYDKKLSEKYLSEIKGK